MEMRLGVSVSCVGGVDDAAVVLFPVAWPSARTGRRRTRRSRSVQPGASALCSAGTGFGMECGDSLRHASRASASWDSLSVDLIVTCLIEDRAVLELLEHPRASALPPVGAQEPFSIRATVRFWRLWCDDIVHADSPWSRTSRRCTSWRQRPDGWPGSTRRGYSYGWVTDTSYICTLRTPEVGQLRGQTHSPRFPCCRRRRRRR